MGERPSKRTLTRTDFKTFAVLSGDLNPTHVDAALHIMA